MFKLKDDETVIVYAALMAAVHDDRSLWDELSEDQTAEASEILDRMEPAVAKGEDDSEPDLWG